MNDVEGPVGLQRSSRALASRTSTSGSSTAAAASSDDLRSDVGGDELDPPTDAASSACQLRWDVGAAGSDIQHAQASARRGGAQYVGQGAPRQVRAAQQAVEPGRDRAGCRAGSARRAGRPSSSVHTRQSVAPAQRIGTCLSLTTCDQLVTIAVATNLVGGCNLSNSMAPTNKITSPRDHELWRRAPSRPTWAAAS